MKSASWSKYLIEIHNNVTLTHWDSSAVKTFFFSKTNLCKHGDTSNRPKKIYLSWTTPSAIVSWKYAYSCSACIDFYHCSKEQMIDTEEASETEIISCKAWLKHKWNFYIPRFNLIFSTIFFTVHFSSVFKVQNSFDEMKFHSIILVKLNENK